MSNNSSSASSGGIGFLWIISNCIHRVKIVKSYFMVMAMDIESIVDSVYSRNCNNNSILYCNNYN